MRRATILAVMLLAGCAVTHETYGPDGRKAYAINCSGMALGWDACLSAAGEKCGSAGYDVIDRSGEGGAVIGGSSQGFFGGSTMNRTMEVSCHAPAVSLAK